MKKLRLARFLAALFSMLPSSNRVHDRNGTISNPFFIISAGRSGSTLLNRILNEHEGLFLPSEQYFLGPSILKFKIYRPIIWRDLLKIILGELARPLQSHTWDIREDAVYQKLIYTPKPQRSLQLIIDSIFAGYGLQQSKTSFRWGDSTPLNCHYIKEITSLFPRACYLFLLRDGREVVSSYYKGGNRHFGELATPLTAATHWNKSIQVLDYLKKSKCHVQLVKYEDLVLHPAESLTAICDFLGVGYKAPMLDYYKNIPDLDIYKEQHHKKLKQPIQTNTGAAWDQDFSEGERAVLQNVLAYNLQRFGYI